MHLVKHLFSDEYKEVANSNDSTPIDWLVLAQQLGTLRDDGENGGSDLASRALEMIIGKDTLRDAVDYYVAGHRGAELARSVLSLLRPDSAVERCLELFRSETPETRRNAVELLRVIGDARILTRVPEFLSDDDVGVQNWGAGVVDQLAFSGLIGYQESSALIEIMLQHSNPDVRRLGAEIRARFVGTALKDGHITSLDMTR